MNHLTGTLEQVSDMVAPVLNTEGQQAETEQRVSINDVVKQQESPNVDMNENIVQFRELNDLTIYKIIDRDTGEELAEISGYALNFYFNTQKLSSTKRIEQCLDGITKLFRRLIVDKILNKPKDGNQWV